MPKLLMSVLADLEFAEGDEIEIENSVLFFMFHKFSEEISYLHEIVCSSRHLQHFIIEALDAETKSHSREIRISFLYDIDEIQNLVHRIWVQFYAQFRYIFDIEPFSDIFDDIYDPEDSNSARRPSSEIEGLYLLIGKYLCIMVHLVLQCVDVVIDKRIGRISRDAIEWTICAFAGTEWYVDIET